MTNPSFLSGPFAQRLLEPTRVECNRRRHSWRWRLVFLLVGICLGWIARGIFN